MNRPIATVLAVILSLVGVWLAGYDFNSRGTGAAVVYINTLFIAGVVWAYPGWKE